jgi:dienelactone hydrolase
MLARLHGVLGALDSKQAAVLAESVDSRPVTPEQAAARAGDVVLLHVHIFGPAGERTIAISHGPDGTYLAQQIRVAAGVPRRALLKPDKLDALIEASDLVLAPVERAHPWPAGVFRVEDEPGLPPPARSAITLDSATARQRLGVTPAMRWGPATRHDKPEFYARVPADLKPGLRAGLVLWMDPTDAGRPPQPIHEALDRWGFISIGAANAGNDHPAVDRLQAGLDALATARRRWLIDPARVYAVGLSGGGKTSSILALAFPDTFAGAVPIVGLTRYRDTPVPDGNGAMWPAEISKPAGPRWTQLKSRRLAAITGPDDGNYASMKLICDVLVADGLNARFVDVPGMGHEFPPAGILAEQLGWVDEPGRTAHNDREARARAAINSLTNLTGAQRAPALRDLIDKHPWTQAAWDAVRELEPGLAPAGGKPPPPKD